MIPYDKMYYIVFNAVTDALEIAKSLSPGPERRCLQEILCAAQRNSEQMYLLSEEDGADPGSSKPASSL